VLLDVLDVLLEYVSQGAQLIRLDAVAYLWKRIGTPCIHLPETHAVVRLMRAVLEEVAPWVLLITETNVPHQDNTSYFGDGTNEAHLVYQFPLPPLVMDAFSREQAVDLTRWAAALAPPRAGTTFFNFLSSHDGIGVNPARGILPEQRIAELGELTLRSGGQVSYKDIPEGRRPYELNITYYDAIVGDPAHQEPTPAAVRRFLTSQAIMLALAGVPGIYIHSLLGSPSDIEGYRRTGAPRSLNRHLFSVQEVEELLSDRESREARCLAGFKQLLAARSALPAFAPDSPQRILNLHPGVFAVVRGIGAEAVLCLHNASRADQVMRVPENFHGTNVVDVIAGEPPRQAGGEEPRIVIDASATLWLSKPERS